MRAGLVPLGQATLLTIYPRESHGYAMAIFSTGAMMGPIIGPTLGGWLTDNFGWRWCFYINLPVGALCALGIFVFIRQTRTMRRDAFDGFGFAMLSLGVGSLQLMLDRGQLKDWFHSTEIWIEATDRRVVLLPARRPHDDRRRALVSQSRTVEEPEFRRRQPVDVRGRHDPQRHLWR